VEGLDVEGLDVEAPAFAGDESGRATFFCRNGTTNAIAIPIAAKEITELTNDCEYASQTTALKTIVDAMPSNVFPIHVLMNIDAAKRSQTAEFIGNAVSVSTHAVAAVSSIETMSRVQIAIVRSTSDIHSVIGIDFDFE
jgi:hypothetical protein